MLIADSTRSTRFRELAWRLERTVAPVDEPVSVSEIKSQGSILHDDLDHDFVGYIKAAREMVELDSRRALLTQTYKLYLPRFPSDGIELHRPPVQSVTSITSIDTAGVSQIWASTDYETDLISEPALIRPAYGKVYPTTRSPALTGVTVTFIAGYTSVANVPSIAIQAIKMLAATWIRQKEAIAEGRPPEEVPFAYSALIMRLKWGGHW